MDARLGKQLLSILETTACSAAHAQSTVTLFGIVDTAYEHVSNRGGAGVNRLISSGWNATRLGFRGTEDLGGGLSAAFWLEGQVATDNGAGVASNTNNQATGAAPAGLSGGQGFTFNRRSTVSLAGAWGEVRLGRDYIPGIFNVTFFDPFLNVGVGASQTFNAAITGVTLVRASNAIGYHTPSNLGGFSGSVMYWMGENASNADNRKDGTGAGFRIGYASGPAEVALSLNRTNYLAGDVRQDNIGGSWNFGFAKLMGMASRDRNGATSARGAEIGVIVPIGSSEIKASYSQYKIRTAATSPESSKLAIGYGYNFSKRTTVYTAYGRVRNENGSTATVSLGAPAAVAGKASSGFDIGIRHAF